MKFKKIILFTIVISGILLLDSCKKKQIVVAPDNSEIETNKMDTTRESEVDAFEKGYDLPVDDSDREEAETDCRNVMEVIQKIYKGSNREESVDTIISDNVVEQMLEKLGELGNPVSTSRFNFNMLNYEKMEVFLKKSLNNEKSEVIIYKLHLDAGIGRLKLTFDGKDMYLLYTNATWKDTNTPIITTTSYTRIKEWKYTPKGWFCYELCVPEPPDVTEVINGNAMLRVQPLKVEYLDIAEKYLLPLGYQGNNLLCSEWDANNMEGLDYNGLYEYLYSIKYQKRFDQEQYFEGIIKNVFENIMMEYLPISAEQLEQYAVFDAESQKYGWLRLGCLNYAPNEFGTSVPEITDMIENNDGTVTITVDAVCEMFGSDAVFTHEITVYFLEGKGIKYLENHVLGDGLEQISRYQYRFGQGKK